jgi:F0F1-type ATP synthase assembly protein I
MKTDFINQIEPTPKLRTSKCKTIAFVLKLLLQYSSFFVGIVLGVIYDYFIGIAFFLFSLLVMGIIKSYLRNSVIPKSQQEYNYTDEGIATWYTARELCIELPSR